MVAKAARERGLPVVVEAERIRYNLDLLLAQADYVVTSGDYPGSWTGEASRGDAILATALRLPHARWMVRSPVASRLEVCVHCHNAACGLHRGRCAWWKMQRTLQ